jgi:hypothetical protein
VAASRVTSGSVGARREAKAAWAHRKNAPEVWTFKILASEQTTDAVILVRAQQTTRSGAPCSPPPAGLALQRSCAHSLGALRSFTQRKGDPADVCANARLPAWTRWNRLASKP